MGDSDTRDLRLGRLESLAALAGGISHELSNLAASVVMSVQLLEPRCDATEDRQVLASLDEMARGLQHAGRQLQWLARGVAGGAIVFQAQYLLSDLQRLLRAAFPSSIAIITRYPPDLWLLSGDPLIVYQLLLSMCLEAREHLAEGGNLVIAARNQVLERASLPARAAAGPGRYVLLEALAEGDPAAGRGSAVPGADALRRRAAAAHASRAARAAGGFAAPLPPSAQGKGRRAYLPAAPEVP
jgi:two-component system cell cycle sensor histidine kinase/response regulator CckA